ncbi:hypothetical protein EJB05_16466 [Eragrostis curvula]|uniref:Uncharacterized protein n=1 Tax=Eragrostis curvula TaxID=38414 RepID=A0A5J9VGN9_9POAL|nr:hypothetical protein EJB05_16466 [Eragrostis curvula]
MVPTRNLLHHDGKNSSKSCYPTTQYCVGISTAQLEASSRQDHHKQPLSRSPRLTMADDELAAAASTSSRLGVGAGDGGDWLQLGLAAAPSSSSASSSGDNNGADPAPTPVELGLFVSCGYDKQHARMRPPLFQLPLRSYQYGGHGRYRPAAASGSVSAPFLPFMPPFRSSGDAMRVISPPRRTEATGLWLTLQAAPNQHREPILPQIPKSYLRIKDSNIKVEVVMKYLAGKLGLTRSHQVELKCRGQVLPPFLLVKYVRDNIWCSSALREEEALAARRSPVAATDNVMTLCYTTSRNRTLQNL